jgi:hypothetical protein
MALVDDILDYLKTTYKPAPGEFLQFDQQRLVDKFKLREQGQERGKKEQPASDLIDLDVVEQNIVEAMRRQAVEDERRTLQQLEYYRDRLKTSNPAGLAQSMMMEANNAVAKFRGAMLSTRAVLMANWKALEERRWQLDEFKTANRLKRPPHPPKDHWMMVSTLILCFVIEIGFNASVLSAGSDYGILGGVISAAFYTASSMIMAYILGFFCITGLLHAHPGRKAFSVFCGLGLLAGIGVINLLAAHYRVAITGGVGELDAAKLAASTMFHDWSLFASDTQSILMIVFSMVVAFVSAAEGYFWQDPYPGYARVGKFLRAAETKWIRSIERTGDELDDIFSHYSRKIEELRTDLARRQAAIPLDLGARRRLVINFNTHLNHIQDVSNFLLENYREANCETRRTEKPSYFRNRWRLETVRPMNEPDDREIGDGGNWDAVGSTLLSASGELNAAHEAAVKWIDHLSVNGVLAPFERDQISAPQKRGQDELIEPAFPIPDLDELPVIVTPKAKTQAEGGLDGPADVPPGNVAKSEVVSARRRRGSRQKYIRTAGVEGAANGEE